MIIIIYQQRRIIAFVVHYAPQAINILAYIFWTIFFRRCHKSTHKHPICLSVRRFVAYFVFLFSAFFIQTVSKCITNFVTFCSLERAYTAVFMNVVVSIINIYWCVMTVSCVLQRMVIDDAHYSYNIYYGYEIEIPLQTGWFFDDWREYWYSDDCISHSKQDKFFIRIRLRAIVIIIFVRLNRETIFLCHFISIISIYTVDLVVFLVQSWFERIKYPGKNQFLFPRRWRAECWQLDSMRDWYISNWASTDTSNESTDFYFLKISISKISNAIVFLHPE